MPQSDSCRFLLQNASKFYANSPLLRPPCNSFQLLLTRGQSLTLKVRDFTPVQGGLTLVKPMRQPGSAGSPFPPQGGTRE